MGLVFHVEEPGFDSQEMYCCQGSKHMSGCVGVCVCACVTDIWQMFRGESEGIRWCWEAVTVL